MIAVKIEKGPVSLQNKRNPQEYRTMKKHLHLPGEIILPVSPG